MTAVILQGFNLSTSQAVASDALQTSLDVNQSDVHFHFPMFNGMNSDGTYRPLPMVHPTAPSTPYLPIKLADDLWLRGQLALMSWGLRNLSGPNKTQVALTRSDIVAGKYDKFFHDSAITVRKWAHPWRIAINPEFNWEGNLSYMPGEDFVACWRHIVDIFRAEGATNVTWVWIANQLSKAGRNTSTAEDRLAPFYPGDDYVDEVGADVYNRGNAEVPNGTWLSFEQIMTGAGTDWLGDTYGTITRLAPTKNFVIGEYASHTGPGDKAAWIRDALATMPVKFPKVVVANYYQIVDGKLDWALKAEDGTALAYSDSVEEGPYVQGGQFIMPPDLQPLRPMTRTIMAGDPMADLALARSTNASLATANVSLATAFDGAQLALTDAQLSLADAQSKRDVYLANLTALRGAARVIVQAGNSAA